MYTVIGRQLQVGIVNTRTCPDLGGASENIYHSISPQRLLAEADTWNPPKGKKVRVLWSWTLHKMNELPSILSLAYPGLTRLLTLLLKVKGQCALQKRVEVLLNYSRREETTCLFLSSDLLNLGTLIYPEKYKTNTPSSLVCYYDTCYSIKILCHCFLWKNKIYLKGSSFCPCLENCLKFW